VSSVGSGNFGDAGARNQPAGHPDRIAGCGPDDFNPVGSRTDGWSKSPSLPRISGTGWNIPA